MTVHAIDGDPTDALLCANDIPGCKQASKQVGKKEIETKPRQGRVITPARAGVSAEATGAASPKGGGGRGSDDEEVESGSWRVGLVVSTGRGGELGGGARWGAGGGTAAESAERAAQRERGEAQGTHTISAQTMVPR